jgi:serine/threonine protein kinase
VVLPQIDGYSGLVQIGAGGFSNVYRARQDRFGRIVAVKVLHAELADEDSQRRFERECRVAGAVSRHPNVVTVLDAGETADGRPFIVMEFMAGGPLSARLATSGPFPVAELLDVGVKIAGALGAVHDAGMLHRDLKPQNILVSDFGEPALADFGISAVVHGPDATAGTASLTPLHTPPEVLEGHPTSVASDVYSLGSALFTLLSGRAPFQGQDGDGLAVVIRRVLTDPPPSIGRADVDAPTEAILAKALAKEPGDRHGSALALAQALQEDQQRLGFPVTSLRRASDVQDPGPLPSVDRTDLEPEEPDEDLTRLRTPADHHTADATIVRPVATRADANASNGHADYDSGERVDPARATAHNRITTFVGLAAAAMVLIASLVYFGSDGKSGTDSGASFGSAAGAATETTTAAGGRSLQPPATTPSTTTPSPTTPPTATATDLITAIPTHSKYAHWKGTSEGTSCPADYNFGDHFWNGNPCPTSSEVDLLTHCDAAACEVGRFDVNFLAHYYLPPAALKADETGEWSSEYPLPLSRPSCGGNSGATEFIKFRVAAATWNPSLNRFEATALTGSIEDRFPSQCNRSIHVIVSWSDS